MTFDLSYNLSMLCMRKFLQGASMRRVLDDFPTPGFHVTNSVVSGRETGYASEAYGSGSRHKRRRGRTNGRFQYHGRNLALQVVREGNPNNGYEFHRAGKRNSGMEEPNDSRYEKGRSPLRRNDFSSYHSEFHDPGRRPCGERNRRSRIQIQ